MSSTAVWVRRGERGWWRIVAALVATAMVAVGLITVLPLTSYADTATGSPDPGSPGVFVYNAGVDSSGTPAVGPRPGGGTCTGLTEGDPTGPAIVEAVALGLLYFIGDVPQEVESFNPGGAGESDANSSPDATLAQVNTGLTTVDDYGFISNFGDDPSNYDAGTGGDIRLVLDANDDEPNAPAGPIDLIVPDGVIATGQISDSSNGDALDLDGSEIFIFEDASTSGMTITLLGDGDPVTITIDDYQRNPDAAGEADDTMIAIDLDSLPGFNGSYVGEIIITDDDIPTSPPGRSDCDTSQTANIIDTSLEIDAVATRTDTVILGIPEIDIEKTTNGVQADTVPEAVSVVPGQPVTWDYTIINIGQVPLVNVEVLDDQLAATAIDCNNSGSNLFAGTLDPGQSFTCVATGVAGTTAYSNNSAVVGTPLNSDGVPVPASDVTDQDPSNYVPVAPAITIEKSTNGADADTTAAAVQVLPGDPITWTYEVSNSGATNLINALVTDDQGVAVTCPGGNPIPQLAIGATVTCTGSGIAGTAAYTNTGSVSATPADAAFVAVPGAAPVDANDPSNYVVDVAASISLEKATNTIDADTPTGPELVTGSAVTWTYVVVNDGSVPLINVTVTDVPAQTIDCDNTGGPTVAGPVAPGGTFTCEATGIATTGQYRNDASVVGTPSDAAGNPVGLPNVEDADPSHYVGLLPSIDIEKLTNDVQADAATPPNPIPVDDTVSWTYIVSNDGPVNLVNVTVGDSQGIIPDCNEGAGPVIADLAPGESVTCFATGVATLGDYENVGTVVGTPADAAGTPVPGATPVNDEDLSHYVGTANPAVTIEKATNGVDADTQAEGPGVAAGAPVTWTYVVTNTGDVPLTTVTVTDDPAETISCDGGTNVVAGPLAPQGSFTCTATGVAGSAPFANTATVVGTPSDAAGAPLNIPGTPTVTDDDPSHYNPLLAGLALQKRTNGQDSDNPAGQPIAAGDPVTWTYSVSNFRQVPLANVTITDSLVPDADIDCGNGTNVIPLLLPGANVTCTATGTAIVGQYSNDSNASGLPAADDGTPLPGQPPVTADDPSNYFGTATPAVQVEKATNGVDSDLAPGETILVGEAVTWDYTVTNTGETTLVGFTVTDDQVASLDCDGTGGPTVAGPIAPGASFTCVATGVAVAGQYTNIATATASPVDAAGNPLTDISGNPVPDVTDTDPSNYFGAEPSVSLIKTVNGADANVAPGVSLSTTGAAPQFIFTVENTGNVPLTNLVITDTAAAGTALTAAQIDCDATGSNAVVGPLAPGDTVTCVGTPAAVDVGQHTNTGAVTADPVALDGTPLPPAVTDDDPANYFGGAAAIDVEKSTNGAQADTAAEAIIVAPGDAVTWLYEVENTGTTFLTNVTITDDQLADTAIDCDATGSNVIAGPIAPGATFTCTATGVATNGAYTNVATAVGDPTDAAGVPVAGEPPATDTDASNYIAGTAAIEVEKATNGVDADTAPEGPTVPVGSPVTWTYEVTNTGEVALSQVTVTDDQVAAADIDCDGTGSNVIAGPIAAGATFTCIATGVAVAGPYVNTATVAADPIDGSAPVGNTDPSNHFGADPSVTLEKDTLGLDSDTPTGAVLGLDDVVTWNYVVTNTGNVDLANVNVSDDQGVTVVCPSSGSNVIALLAVGLSETCTATDDAELGQYANLGLVSGDPIDAASLPIPDPAGGNLGPVTADDPSHYIGVGEPGVSIVKSANGSDANTTADAVSVVTGDTVTFTYVVTNTGNVDLSPAVVTDDQGVAVVCEGSTDGTIATLAVGATVECTGTAPAIAGPYTNLGEVTGTPVDENGDPALDENGDPLAAVVVDDPANYFGGDSAVDVEKTTNGEQADLPADAVALTVGDAVTWEYTVANTGNLDLVNVLITDSDAAVTVTCPGGNPIPSIPVGAAAVVCTAAGVATEGAYTNTATAAGTDSEGTPIQDSDDSNYLAAPAPVYNLGDYVWLDANSDGVQDTGETPIEGVTLTLTDAAGTVLGTQTTDANGAYLFAGLAPGTYTVTVDPATLPAGVSQTFDADGGLDNTSTVTIVADDDTDQDFGYVVDPVFDLGDYVWLDANEDGVQDTGEAALANVTLTLTDAAGTVLDTEMTDATGAYLFTGLAPGTYTVTVDPATLPAGVFQTFDADGTLDNTSTATIVDDNVLDQDFGYDSPDPLFELGDFVWIDANADGVVDTGEAPLEGIVLTLTDDAGATQTATTNADGLYLFSGLPAGTYTVTVDPSTLPAGLTQTFDADGGLDNTSTVVLTDNDLDQDFGYVAVPSVELEKSTNDQDADDPAQAPSVQVGDTVTWTYVVTNTGAVDVTSVVVTDNQVAASDIVCEGSTDNTVATLAAGATVTCTATGVAVLGAYANTGTVNAVGPNGEALEADDPSNYVGTAEPLGSIGDLVWLDVDGDENPAGEGGIEGVTLELVDADGNVVQTQVTNAAGEYLFTNVPAGTYTVTVNKSVGFPAGLERTFDQDGLATPNASALTLAPGGQDLDQDFGYKEPDLFKVGDYVWLDNNGDGVQDAGEAPLEGVTVTLTDTAGTVIGTTTTDAAGSYLFDNVAPGTYTVTIDTATLPADVIATFDADGGLDSTSVVTITTTDNLDQDFGYQQQQSIGDFVFVDTNANGLQDEGEPGVEDATINLWSVDANGAPAAILDTTKSDADGAYGFVVPPGDYILQFVTPAGEDLTTPNAGDDSLDSDADPATGVTAVITVVGGVSDSTIDAGIVALTSGVTIEKTTNGEDADVSPGPQVAPGSTVTWTYTVTNTGTAALTDIVVTDDMEGTCTVADLDAGESDTCTITGTAIEGAYTNNAVASATPVDRNGDPLGDPITDEDPSNYTGVPNTPGISVEKSTLGQDADSAPGPRLSPGSVVTWTYVVSNTGDVPLTSVGLNDDIEGGVSCPKTELAAGESMTCTTQGYAVEGQYRNVATVSGTPPTGDPVTGEDPSHYIGVPKAVPATVVPAPSATATPQPTATPRPAPAPVVVVVQPPAPNPMTPMPAGVPLAVTGRDSTDLALVAATLIVAGAGFVALGRRRNDGKA